MASKPRSVIDAEQKWTKQKLMLRRFGATADAARLIRNASVSFQQLHITYNSLYQLRLMLATHQRFAWMLRRWQSRLRLRLPLADEEAWRWLMCNDESSLIEDETSKVAHACECLRQCSVSTNMRTVRKCRLTGLRLCAPATGRHRWQRCSSGRSSADCHMAAAAEHCWRVI